MFGFLEHFKRESNKRLMFPDCSLLTASTGKDTQVLKNPTFYMLILLLRRSFTNTWTGTPKKTSN